MDTYKTATKRKKTRLTFSWASRDQFSFSSDWPNWRCQVFKLITEGNALLSILNSVPYKHNTIHLSHDRVSYGVQINISFISQVEKHIGRLDCFRTYEKNTMLTISTGNSPFLQLSAYWPGLWMAARLELTLFWYRPHCFCCVNQVVLMLTSWHLNEKAEKSVSKQGQLQPRLHSKAR